MNKVYVIGTKRSAIGSFMGTLSSLHPADFGSQVLKTLIKESQINVNDINEVLVGNILPAGLKQGVARQVSILAGIPSNVPAYGVNMVCGSGMKSVMNGFSNIALGLHDLVIAGGVESMSGAPYLVTGQVRTGIKMGEQPMRDHMLYDALTDAFEGYHMGITAEHIVEKYGLTREEQDAFAWESQKKAMAAQDQGKFKDEIATVLIPSRKGDIVFDQDEFINRQTSFEKLSQLRPAFKKDGSVTAGSSSGINDGASFMILASEDYVKKNNIKPLFEIVGIGQGGVDPSVMGLGPTPAIKQALKHAHLNLTDIDTFELNEAFAAQSLGVIKELTDAFKVTKEYILARTNPNGGAIALGHPVGASGNRIMVTLAHEMLKNPKLNIGLASLCIGGGMGTAVILKKVI
ncbi:MAG: acetyl-CoA acetyltransferase [Tenericutes bacterium GWC2_34_14]|nr:MAG: acetyl-CoA acetyltransferase [Tenericutes bacterium GWA2_35_7]OHE29501.1 MAG: acetyl-CoA acetyltransferase [Tenericutes bacterium GWC2_34_14]OHE34597.1 MAG: acetyl-CoA acetyltransferase [Tenericutes bacterium GWE2_34_108]OHE35954.1 MAG: acetyl-CoA acetyltransferase [Tenericutes bacterium GWF1_35_14]OHE38960.1 MAG: acetyl-CoA acetyltransferase [Tenericutes bacterium GWF2_35_184]OHE42973.1 MAG: acetyl-CoA acetyltransferase [Tenericutes bacterium RIFOXYA2_FULL_36_32]OHE45629.1 MAG: acety